MSARGELVAAIAGRYAQGDRAERRKIRVAKLQRIRETTFRAFTQNLATRVIEKTTLGVANES